MLSIPFHFGVFFQGRHDDVHDGTFIWRPFIAGYEPTPSILVPQAMSHRVRTVTCPTCSNPDVHWNPAFAFCHTCLNCERDYGIIPVPIEHWHKAIHVLSRHSQFLTTRFQKVDVRLAIFDEWEEYRLGELPQPTVGEMFYSDTTNVVHLYPSESHSS